MVRPLLLISIIVHFCAFAAPDKKQKIVIHHVPIKPIDTGIHNHLRVTKTHRTLSKSNQAPQAGQRIVILAGPHKTASSSIQQNMYTWTSTDPQVLPDWSWPIPPEVFEFCQDHRVDNHGLLTYQKGFYPLAEAINVRVANMWRPIFQRYNKRKVMGFYRDAIEKEWKDGYNVIVGTEGLDMLVVEDSTVFDNFLSVLPMKKDESDGREGIDRWGADKKDVTVVVKFRAPRVEQLISLWHQCCTRKPNVMTFFEFLNTYLVEKDVKLHILASLELSDLFLERGFDVVLMDMGGIIHEGYDISNVVACDILKVNCTEEEEIILVPGGGEEENVSPIVSNVKHNKGKMGGVTDFQLNKIELVLRRYDCNHQHVLEHENITVLYNWDLGPIIDECSKMKESDAILSRHELALKLRSIANMASDMDEDYYTDTGIGET